jgi:hypothetical protein
LDARYCSLSRVSFGLNAGGAERAREATCGLPPALVWSGAAGSGHNLSGHCILALASAAQLLARVARLFTIDALILARDAQPVTYCARVAQLLARVALYSLTPGRRRAVPTSYRPWVSSRAARRPTAPCTLSHLAGVCQCPLAIGHGFLVGLLAGVLDRRPVSPLSSTSACSGAGLGWHGRRRIADSTVYLEGLATGGAGHLSCANSWAVTVVVWRIASVARLRRSRAQPVSRPGTTVDALSAKLASSPSRPHWGPVMHDSCPCRQSRWARRGRATNQQASGLLTTQPASGVLNRPVACSPSAGGAGAGPVPAHHRHGCCRP